MLRFCSAGKSELLTLALPAQTSNFKAIFLAGGHTFDSLVFSLATLHLVMILPVACIPIPHCPLIAHLRRRGRHLLRF